MSESWFAQVVAEENLRRAWEAVEAKGRAGGSDGVGIKAFRQRVSIRLEALRRDLVDGSYVPEPGLRMPLTCCSTTATRSSMAVPGRRSSGWAQRFARSRPAACEGKETVWSQGVGAQWAAFAGFRLRLRNVRKPPLSRCWPGDLRKRSAAPPRLGVQPVGFPGSAPPGRGGVFANPPIAPAHRSICEVGNGENSRGCAETRRPAGYPQGAICEPLPPFTPSWQDRFLLNPLPSAPLACPSHRRRKEAAMTRC